MVRRDLLSGFRGCKSQLEPNFAYKDIQIFALRCQMTSNKWKFFGSSEPFLSIKGSFFSLVIFEQIELLK